MDGGALKKVVSTSQALMIDLDVFQGCLLECALLELINANIYHALRELFRVQTLLKINNAQDFDLSMLTNL